MPASADRLFGSAGGHVTRPATYHMATRRREPIELVARRPSTMSATTLWASGWVGWRRDAVGGVAQQDEATQVPQVRCARVLCIPSAAAVPTASTVAESVQYSMLDARAEM